MDHLDMSRNMDLCNLKVLVAHREWTQDKTIRWIPDCFDEARINVLMSHLVGTLEIGQLFHSAFNITVWSWYQVFIKCGKLTMNMASPQYLATMPFDVFCTVPKTVYDSRRETISMASIFYRNWELANHLWNNDCINYLHTMITFEIDANMNTQSVLPCTFNDLEFNCLKPVNSKFKMFSTWGARFNSALQFMENKPHTVLATAFHAWTSQLYSKQTRRELVWIFERGHCAHPKSSRVMRQVFDRD